MLVYWPFPSRVSPLDGDTVRSSGDQKRVIRQFGCKGSTNNSKFKIQNSKFAYRCTFFEKNTRALAYVKKMLYLCPLICAAHVKTLNC